MSKTEWQEILRKHGVISAYDVLCACVLWSVSNVKLLRDVVRNTAMLYEDNDLKCEVLKCADRLSSLLPQLDLKNTVVLFDTYEVVYMMYTVFMMMPAVIVPVVSSTSLLENLIYCTNIDASEFEFAKDYSKTSTVLSAEMCAPSVSKIAYVLIYLISIRMLPAMHVGYDKYDPYDGRTTPSDYLVLSIKMVLRVPPGVLFYLLKNGYHRHIISIDVSVPYEYVVSLYKAHRDELSSSSALSRVPTWCDVYKQACKMIESLHEENENASRIFLILSLMARIFENNLKNVDEAMSEMTAALNVWTSGALTKVDQDALKIHGVLPGVPLQTCTYALRQICDNNVEQTIQYLIDHPNPYDVNTRQNVYKGVGADSASLGKGKGRATEQTEQTPVSYITRFVEQLDNDDDVSSKDLERVQQVQDDLTYEDEYDDAYDAYDRYQPMADVASDERIVTRARQSGQDEEEEEESKPKNILEPSRVRSIRGRGARKNASFRKQGAYWNPDSQ